MPDQAESAVGSMDRLSSLMGDVGDSTEPEREQQAPPQQDQPESEPQQQEPEQQTEQGSQDEPVIELDCEYIPVSKIKEWKSGHLMQSDYTRKTQEVAEQRRAIEAQRAELQKHVEFQQQFIKDYAELVALDQQLAAYEQLDWNKLVDQDTMHYLVVKAKRDEIRSERERKATELAQKQQEAARNEQEARAKMIREGIEEVRKHIPDFTPELGRKINEFGQKFGFTYEELASITDPRYVRVLHKAYLYDDLQAQKAKVNQKIAAAPPVIKPGAHPQSVKQMNREQARARLRESGRVEDLARVLEI